MNELRLWPSLAILGFAAAWTLCLLIVEDQWMIWASVAVAAIAVFLIARAKVGAGLGASLNASGHLFIGLVAALVITIAAVIHDGHFQLMMLASVLIYGLVCIGLTIQFGYAGVINFAGAAFFGIGGYTAAVLGAIGIPSLLILLAGGLLAALVGGLIILPILRTRGHYSALITIAFGLLFQIFLEVNETLGGPQGLKVEGARVAGWSLLDGFSLFGYEVSFYFNYVLLAAALFTLAFVLTRNMERSWIGINLDAVREDEVGAAVFGINVVAWRIFAIMVGNFVIGIAGALFAMMQNFIAPSNFTFSDSLLMLSIIVIGGIGNLWALLPAAIIVILIPEKLQEIGEYRILIFAILVALVLRFRPDGLFPRPVRQFKAEVER